MKTLLMVFAFSLTSASFAETVKFNCMDMKSREKISVLTHSGPSVVNKTSVVFADGESVNFSNDFVNDGEIDVRILKKESSKSINKLKNIQEWNLLIDNNLYNGGATGKVVYYHTQEIGTKATEVSQTLKEMICRAP